MKTSTTATLGLAMLLWLTSAPENKTSWSVDPAVRVQRISFHVAAVEESRGKRKVVSDATIDGMPGTDFVIDLQANRFKMSARFLTDLVSTDALRIRTKLITRRFYGYSEHNLPIYEEDDQAETLLLGFGEQITLLPFGRNGGDDLLKIEITPSKSERILASSKVTTPEINIVDPGPGFISIKASRSPHNFDVSALLFEDGREIARGRMNCLLEEPQEITLQAAANAVEAFENPIALRFMVERFERNESTGQASITFDAHQLNNRSDARQPIAVKWAGVVALGNETGYDLKGRYLPAAGKRYELRFIVNLAPNEQQN